MTDDDRRREHARDRGDGFRLRAGEMPPTPSSSSATTVFHLVTTPYYTRVARLSPLLSALIKIHNTKQHKIIRDMTVAQKKNGGGLFGGGDDDDDCERPACDDVKQTIPKSMEEFQALKASAAKKKVECPPRSAELGRSSWKLLHTMVAWYPDKPSTNQRHKMNGFFHALSEFYPCTWCAADFQQEIQTTPPATESRKDLCLWLCDQHNRVNKKVGKPLFDCTMKNLDERWRKSSNKKCHSDH